MENVEITISGLLAPGGGNIFDWKLEAGRSYLVDSNSGPTGRKLLDHLAGHSQDKRLTILETTTSGQRQLPSLPSVGVLPPAGDEIFVGTTVGEQLNFFSAGNLFEEMEQSGLDRLFEFKFSERQYNSVWELGSGERRCLLLVSQALARPRFWVLHEPLDRMDGPRAKAVEQFIRGMRGRGDTLLIAATHPEEMLPVNSHLLALEGGSLQVEFYGDGARAAEFLAGRYALPLENLVSQLSRSN